MDRREFIKKSGMAIGAVALATLTDNPIMAALNKNFNYKKDTGMKKIMIIDGGPRKNMNTAQMVEKFAGGAKEGGAEVKIVRLYDIDYKGCRSCMACQLKGKRVDSCRFNDGLTDILAECTAADGLVLASPIYYGEITAQLRAFYERLTFPWLSYSKGSMTVPKKMPVTMIYTMNATPEQAEMLKGTMGMTEKFLGMALGCEVEVLQANCTKQVKDYSRYDFSEEMAKTHDKWHDEHFEEELQRASDAGKRMAKQLIG
jgi:multimeric flavodoxin WrbA